MAPFIVNHPTLLHNWIYCREKALKEIRSIENINADDFKLFRDCFNKSKSSIDTWLTDSQYQIDKINSLKSDLSKFTRYLENDCSTKINYLWNQIYMWVEKNLGEECIEYIVSMMMEPYDNIIDPLINDMSSEEEKYFNIPAHRKDSDLRKIIENNYKSINKIRGRNLFSRVDQKTLPGSTSGLKILQISVEEKATGELMAGAGVGTEGTSLQFAVSENNWLGRGINLQSVLNLSEEKISGNIKVSNPNYNFSGNELRFTAESTKTSKMKEFGYDSTKTGFSLGTNLLYPGA